MIYTYTDNAQTFRKQQNLENALVIQAMVIHRIKSKWQVSTLVNILGIKSDQTSTQANMNMLAAFPLCGQSLTTARLRYRWKHCRSRPRATEDSIANQIDWIYTE